MFLEQPRILFCIQPAPTYQPASKSLKKLSQNETRRPARCCSLRSGRDPRSSIVPTGAAHTQDGPGCPFCLHPEVSSSQERPRAEAQAIGPLLLPYPFSSASRPPTFRRPRLFLFRLTYITFKIGKLTRLTP